MQEEYMIAFSQLDKTLKQLQKALEKPLDKDNMNRDATIQRFKFTAELFLRILKKCLLVEKMPTTSPRDTLQKAYSFNWIDEEKIWLRMLDDRNLTSYMYNEERANYSRIRNSRAYPGHGCRP